MNPTKPPLLLLCHRFPFPPDKGDKIRSYNLLLHLSKRYSVHLGAFVDDPQDLQHVEKLQSLCKSLQLISFNPRIAKIASMRGIFGRHSLTTLVYRSRVMQRWVDELLLTNSRMPVIAFSAAVSQFLMKSDSHMGVKIIDFVDVDSDKWRQYATKLNWPISWLYARESKTLEAFEHEACAWADRSFFVSRAEARLFANLHPKLKNKIDYFYNGVDFEYFTPDKKFENPYLNSDKIIVFTGAMDYWPNVDAVVWFAEHVLPELLRRDNAWRFYIVGSKPDEAVKSLGDHKSITVTGQVYDVRPYLNYATVSVAPMRIARGIQNKVLEAMAMQRTVIVSSKGLEGIGAVSQEHVLVANDPREYIEYIGGLDTFQSNVLGEAARQFVINKFEWTTNLSRLDQAINSY